MKPSRKYSKPVLLGILVISTLALVAWSPPTGEDILMTTGTPAIAIGNTNSINGGTTVNPVAFRGIIAGNANNSGTGNSNGYAAIIGSSNTVNAYSSVIAGNSNVVANGATSGTASLTFSGIFGTSNVIPLNCDSLLVSGSANSVNGSYSFASGSTNTVEGATGGPAYSSAAIGELNHVAASRGYAIGYQNNVTGDRGVAIGKGVNAINESSTALGRYNATMASGDVLVVGTGSSDTIRNTALRVTSDGGVILGRAQGDISMGAYAN